MKITDKIVEQIYAGWLGKAIGIRYGAPVEMWTAEQIDEKYAGEEGYFVDYRDFAADDDSNGPVFFYRGFLDCPDLKNVTAEQIGEGWLNYAPYRHGFYWWGGYGVSTEHTAYLNMTRGIHPPRSGSMLQNGKLMAEQIGGQIFSDIWGLVYPGEPCAAADLAEKASRVSHDGNGVYGGRFVAACIASAFTASGIEEILSSALSTIPFDCDYAKMARDIIRFHGEENSQKECFEYIRRHYWKDKFGGNCHIIPNAAIMVMSLLYGEGDFERTLKIANYSGFDTDCNAGNLGTILGVFCGLEKIGQKWRLPVNDTTLCSSVLGASNIVDIPTLSKSIASAAVELSGESYDGRYALRRENVCDCDKNIREKAADCGNIVGARNSSTVRDLETRSFPPAKDFNTRYFPTAKGCDFDFTLPGSTHGFRAEGASLENIGGKLWIKAETQTQVYIKTYYGKSDLHDNRYDPCFSPVVVPGNTLYAKVKAKGGKVRLFYRDRHTGEIFCSRVGESVLSLKIDAGREMLVDRVGLLIEGEACIERFGVFGGADYRIDFSREYIEDYSLEHKEVSGCTYFKGLWTLEEGSLFGRCFDEGELYTSLPLRDFTLKAELTLCLGDAAGILFRVQGASRSYGIFFGDGEMRLVKKRVAKRDRGEALSPSVTRETLAAVACPYRIGSPIELSVRVSGGRIEAEACGVRLEYADRDSYSEGCIGAAVLDGSVVKINYFDVNETGGN